MKKSQNKASLRLLRQMAIFVAGLLIVAFIGAKLPSSYLPATINDQNSHPPTSACEGYPSHVEYPPGYDGSIYACDLRIEDCSYYCYTI